MFGKIKREQEQQRRDFTWLADEIRKMRDLFTKDSHGTVRPKVDLLLDGFNTSEVRFCNALNKLNKRIEILEKSRELEKRKEERYVEKTCKTK